MTAMDFRQYDAALGRFIAMDRLTELASGITPYRFAFNNPNYWSDPTGLFETREAALAHISQYGLTGTSLTYNSDTGLWTIHSGGYSFYQSLNKSMVVAYDTEGGGVGIAIIGGIGGPNSGSGFAGGTDFGGAGSFGSSNSDLIGLGIGTVGTISSGVSGYAMYRVASGFKSSNNLWDFHKLPKKSQNWRIKAELGPKGNAVLGKHGLKILKYSKAVGVVGTVASVGYSGYKIYEGTATTIDYVDAGVGTTSIVAVVLLSSNPIGWAIGAGAGVYFAGRFIYDLIEETND